MQRKSRQSPLAQKHGTLAILTCTMLLASLPGWAASYNREVIARLLPQGCTPREDVDTLYLPNTLGMMKGSRNEITCREKVPAAIWPHPDVPKPRWPKAQPVPHEFDLAKATNNGEGSATDRIASAYFTHLCRSESGVWFYRKVTDPQPVSVINLRPRKDVSADTALMYDRYWLEAGGITAGLMNQFSYSFKGQRPYRVPSDPTTGYSSRALQEELYEREWDPVAKRATYWLRTNPPRQFEPGWFAWERTPGAITFVERPVAPLNTLTPDDVFLHKAQGFSLLRFAYAPIGALTKVKLASGREVMAEAPAPLPTQCVGDNWKKQDLTLLDDPAHLASGQRACFQKFGPQHLIVTPTNESQARYGYVWREVFRSEHDLRLGITGAEVMVVDMRTGETIGLHRSFTRKVPVEPHVPRGTSVRIDNEEYQCVDRNGQLKRTGNTFLGASIGTDPAWLDPRLTSEPIEVSPRPAPGDLLETR